MKNNRRDFIIKSSSMAAAISLAGLSGNTISDKSIGKKNIDGKSEKRIEWPIAENPDIPKLCVGVSMNAEEKIMKQIKQIGVDYVLMGGPPIPWTVEALRTIMDRFRTQG